LSDSFCCKTDAIYIEKQRNNGESIILANPIGGMIMKEFIVCYNER